jgi:hypothetical protein
MPVETVKWTCFAISAPWSQVMERHSSFGRVEMTLPMAASTAPAE